MVHLKIVNNIYLKLSSSFRCSGTGSIVLPNPSNNPSPVATTLRFVRPSTTTTTPTPATNSATSKYTFIYLI